jgi:hypothetical protein
MSAGAASTRVQKNSGTIRRYGERTRCTTSFSTTRDSWVALEYDFEPADFRVEHFSTPLLLAFQIQMIVSLLCFWLFPNRNIDT